MVNSDKMPLEETVEISGKSVCVVWLSITLEVAKICASEVLLADSVSVVLVRMFAESSDTAAMVKDNPEEDTSDVRLTSVA